MLTRHDVFMLCKHNLWDLRGGTHKPGASVSRMDQVGEATQTLSGNHPWGLETVMIWPFLWIQKYSTRSKITIDFFSPSWQWGREVSQRACIVCGLPGFWVGSGAKNSCVILHLKKHTMPEKVALGMFPAALLNNKFMAASTTPPISNGVDKHSGTSGIDLWPDTNVAPL